MCNIYGYLDLNPEDSTLLGKGFSQTVKTDFRVQMGGLHTDFP